VEGIGCRGGAADEDWRDAISFALSLCSDSFPLCIDNLFGAHYSFGAESRGACNVPPRAGSGRETG